MRRQKEVYAPAIAWSKLTPEKREKVLTQLEVTKQPATKKVNVRKVVTIDNWWELPAGTVRMQLVAAFKDGRFSKEEAKQHMKRVASSIQADAEMVRQFVA